MTMATAEKIEGVIAHWQRYLENDDPPNTDHQTAYAWGCIDGLRLALIMLDDPTFDVKSFRSEFMPLRSV
jgi:hypothetical protein